MNGASLIHGIVQQVTVLIAQVATAGGVRAPLSHIANQVFVELARELEGQGVSRKVSADMFGMALRAYQRKLKRLAEVDPGDSRSLWREMLDALSAGPLSRSALLARFERDDEVVVRALLRDLVDSGQVLAEGRGESVRYRAASDAELHQKGLGSDELLVALVYRYGPVGASELGQRSSLTSELLRERLAKLVAEGRIRRRHDRYRALDFSVVLGGEAGFEAAVFDHVQAMVQTICQRLRGAAQVPNGDEQLGGSTYTFDVWDGHPLAHEVEASLARFRREHTDLRERVDAYNRQHGRPEAYRQVVLYAGQCSLDQEMEIDAE